MPLYTTEAIILRTYKLGEADRIVVFLTRDRGKRRGVAQGARRMRSRFGGALEPLTRVEVTYFEKESRELVSLNYAEPLSSPLWSVRADALGHTGYFAELIDECALEGDADERLYRLGSSLIDALAAGVPIEALARYFEVLAPAAAGRLSDAAGVPVAVGRGGGVSEGRGASRPGSDRGPRPVAAGPARTGGGAPHADRGAPREGPEVGPRAQGAPRAVVG